MTRWLLPLGLFAALAGYFGPWIDHRVAGLVITGLDLGEYVKFLPIVREGTVTLWRPGFYAPLVAISAAALLAAYRNDISYRWWLRLPLLTLATIAALNLVPPAWTPTRLLEPEFRWQTTSLLLLLLGITCAPLLALLPHKLAAILVTLLALCGIIGPSYGLWRVFGAIESLYGHNLVPGWGLWLMVIGLCVTLWAYWQLPARHKHSDREIAAQSQQTLIT